MKIKFVMAFTACAVLFGPGCSRSKAGALQGIAYRLTLDSSYRRADTPKKVNEHVWYSDRVDAPIVSVHVADMGHECIQGRDDVGWSDGLHFFPDVFNERQPGKNASMTACSTSHPRLTVTCAVYFRDRRLDVSRARESLAPCRSLVLQ